MGSWYSLTPKGSREPGLANQNTTFPWPWALADEWVFGMSAELLGEKHEHQSSPTGREPGRTRTQGAGERVSGRRAEPAGQGPVGSDGLVHTP